MEGAHGLDWNCTTPTPRPAERAAIRRPGPPDPAGDPAGTAAAHLPAAGQATVAASRAGRGTQAAGQRQRWPGQRTAAPMATNLARRAVRSAAVGHPVVTRDRRSAERCERCSPAITLVHRGRAGGAPWQHAAGAREEPAQRERGRGPARARTVGTNLRAVRWNVRDQHPPARRRPRPRCGDARRGSRRPLDVHDTADRLSLTQRRLTQGR